MGGGISGVAVAFDDIATAYPKIQAAAFERGYRVGATCSTA